MKLDTTTDLDLFSDPPEERSVAESRVEILSANIPLPNDDVSTALEFRIPNAPDWFTDLSPTLLELHMKIQYATEKEAEKGIPKTKQIGLVPNALMSMFSGITLYWNNQLVFQSNNCLPWAAYLDVLSSYSYDKRKSWLSASGWYDGGLDGLSPQLLETFKPFYENGTGRYIGPIQMDFFKVRKYVIPGVEMVVRLFRQDPKCFLMYAVDPAKPESFKVVIERAYLHVRRIKLHDTSLAAIEKRLLSTPAMYSFTETVLKPIIVPENVTSLDVNLYDGVLPVRLDIVQLRQSDFSGPILNNPFRFMNYLIKSVTLEKNGVLVTPPYQCDFKSGNYVRMFLDYFKNSGCTLDSAGMSEISFANYAEHYMIVSYNLERFDECASTLKPSSELGNLRLKIEYDSGDQAMVRPLAVLCLMKFNRAVKLNAQRMLVSQ